MRREIGQVIQVAAIAEIPNLIEATLRQADDIRDRTRAARSRWIFNLGKSSRAAAGYLASLDGGPIPSR